MAAATSPVSLLRAAPRPIARASDSVEWLDSVIRRLPFSGHPITLFFGPGLTAHRGKVLQGSMTGIPIHAGSHIRRREMVIDTDLLGDRVELCRIFVHEVGHFVWAKLGNNRRRGYEALLQDEFQSGAPGELGWSAERLKQKLRPEDRRNKTRRWRDYVCESFCDTAAWKYSRARSHAEWTLAGPKRDCREEWLVRIIEEGELRV